jgi:hypothetical protein
MLHAALAVALCAAAAAAATAASCDMTQAPPPMGHALLACFQLDSNYTNLNHGAHLFSTHVQWQPAASL